MSELSTQIKRLAHTFPGSTAELARKTKIDRSTLYKILGGQRIPTEQQLQSLLSALHAGEAEYASLMRLYSQSQQTATSVHRDKLLYKLLTSPYRALKIIRESKSLPAPDCEPVHAAPQFLRGEALQQFLLQRLRQYLLGQDNRPLMLSPRLGEHASRLILQAFSTHTDQTKPVWQIFQFVQGGTADSFDRNMEALSTATPLLLLPGIHYEGRMCYTSTQASQPGLPMPVYLLFPDLCVFMDEAEQNAVCLDDPDAVAFVRLQFSRQYLRVPHPLFLQSTYRTSEEAMAQAQALTVACDGAFLLRDQPPLVGCLTQEMIREGLLPDAPSARMGIPELLTHQQDIAALAPHAYFTESGVLRFLRTGRIDDIPPDLYDPLPPRTRLELLRIFRDQCAADSPRILRLLHTKKVPVDPDLVIDIYHGQGVLVGQYCTNRDRYRHCILQEPTVTNTLFSYLQELRTSELVCSQTYTVEFLDYCLQGGFV